MLLGVDTGGTFTDFVWFDGERLKIHKVLSTPDAPERAILKGMRELGLSGETYHLVHGSTVATNAVLEGKGARVAYVTSKGFADVLTLGRQEREQVYQLRQVETEPPVPPEDCLQVSTRIWANSSLLDESDDEELLP